MRPATPKRAKQLRQYRPLADEYLEFHPFCMFPGCHRRSEVVHHRAGRRGERLLYVPWWAASCKEHNDEAESGDVDYCRRVGWLLPMDAPIPLERAS